MQIKAHVHISRHRHEPSGQIDQPCVDRMLDVLFLLALELVNVLDQLVDGAELIDEFGGGLGADAFDARDIVGAVADEGLVVDGLLWRDAFLFKERGRIDQGVGMCVKHDSPVGDDLFKVLVFADHAQCQAGRDGVEVAALRLRGKGRHDVVGFVVVCSQDYDAEGLGDLDHARDLGLEVFRRRVAVGLVLRVEVIAKGFALRFHRHGEIRRLVFPVDLQEHVREGEGRIGRFAGDGGGHAAADGEV